MNKLDVFFNNELIAHVTYSAYEDKYEFLYKDSWKESGFELSPHLSFDKDASSKTVKNFIENLLPEGRALDDIVRFNNLSKNNHFAILGAIGSETAGAITFISEQSRAEDLFREVSLDELGERVKQREFQSIAVWDGKVRVSIAGVQDKLPLVIIDGKIGFGEGKYASTHILKFGNQRDENIVLNEYVSLKLLESAGFKVANSSLWNLAGESVLVVERFDRAIEEGGVKRTHIIDACQMLDMPASYKYEQNFGNGRDVKNIREGVSFKKLFSLADRCRVPVVAKKELIAWVCGNLILGNSDAHGKNISFLVNRDGIEIAPVYDVTNISLLGERYDSSIAMSINEEHNIEALTNYDFEEFCSENNINMDFFTTTFEKISKNIIKGFDSKALISEIEKFGGTNFLAHYKEDVLRRSDKLLSVLNFFDCDEGELPDRDDIKAMSKTEREDAVRALADGDSGLKLK